MQATVSIAPRAWILCKDSSLDLLSVILMAAHAEFRELPAILMVPRLRVFAKVRGRVGLSLSFRVSLGGWQPQEWHSVDHSEDYRLQTRGLKCPLPNTSIHRRLQQGSERRTAQAPAARFQLEPRPDPKVDRAHGSCCQEKASRTKMKGSQPTVEHSMGLKEQLTYSRQPMTKRRKSIRQAVYANIHA